MSYAKRIKDSAAKFHDGPDQPALSIGKSKKKSKRKKGTVNSIKLEGLDPDDVELHVPFQRNGGLFEYALDEDGNVVLLKHDV